MVSHILVVLHLLFNLLLQTSSYFYTTKLCTHLCSVFTVLAVQERVSRVSCTRQIRSPYIVEDDLEFLSSRPRCWDFRCVPPSRLCAAEAMCHTHILPTELHPSARACLQGIYLKAKLSGQCPPSLCTIITSVKMDQSTSLLPFYFLLVTDEMTILLPSGKNLHFFAEIKYTYWGWGGIQVPSVRHRIKTPPCPEVAQNRQAPATTQTCLLLPGPLVGVEPRVSQSDYMFYH